MKGINEQMIDTIDLKEKNMTETENKSDVQKDFENKLTKFREEIGVIGKQILELKKHELFSSGTENNTPNPVNGYIYKYMPIDADPNEMMANIMLSYRLSEDLRMRIGKIFQALDGGKSVYNR